MLHFKVLNEDIKLQTYEHIISLNISKYNIFAGAQNPKVWCYVVPMVEWNDVQIFIEI